MVSLVFACASESNLSRGKTGLRAQKGTPTWAKSRLAACCSPPSMSSTSGPIPTGEREIGSECDAAAQSPPERLANRRAGDARNRAH